MSLEVFLDDNELIKGILKGPSHQKYDDRLKTFVLTLDFYSRKAYTFLRDTFNNSLPHPSVIAEWYRSDGGKAGFTAEAHCALRSKVSEANGKVLVSLVMDTMCADRRTGYVDIGVGIDADCIPESREVFFFMVVSLNDHWKVPIGYFIVDQLSGSERANLVLKCLEFLSATGIKVTSFTFAEAGDNMSMAKQLGANFDDVHSLKTYFINPTNNDKIYLFLDPSRMAIFVRLFLESQKDIKTPNNDKIQWAYLQKLLKLKNESAAFAKLKENDMHWAREKIKSKVPVQIFSKSVADALLFLAKDFEQFKGAEATANFILLFNDLYDIFSSKNVFSKSLFKKPLSVENEEHIFRYLDYYKSYINGLRVGNQPALRTQLKIGFVSFLICIESLKGLFNDFVKCDAPLLNRICTYKLSQDNLEELFNVIRNRCRTSHPAADQFQEYYRKLLFHKMKQPNSNVRQSVSNDNCNSSASTNAVDTIFFLYGSSSALTRSDEVDDLRQSKDYQLLSSALNELEYLASPAWHLTDNIEDKIVYVAKFVAKTVGKRLNCTQCRAILSNRDLPQRNTYRYSNCAPNFVIEICKNAEKCVRFLLTTSRISGSGFDGVKKRLLHSCIRNLDLKVFNSFGDHRFDSDPLHDHAFIVVKLIVEKYVEVRLHHEKVPSRNLPKRYRRDRVNRFNIRELLQFF